MSKKNLLNNLFLHEKYFDTFFNQNLREKRLEDINNLSKFYSKNKLLKVTKDYSINEKLLEKWINSHKTEDDKNIARNLMKPITYISFDLFYENLLYSTKKFNQYINDNKIKKYLPFTIFSWMAVHQVCHFSFRFWLGIFLILYIKKK